jgi:hypothetical protein
MAISLILDENKNIVSYENAFSSSDSINYDQIDNNIIDNIENQNQNIINDKYSKDDNTYIRNYIIKNDIKDLKSLLDNYLKS